ncbi:receptor-like protein EIX1 [Cannabis sativa]|uniref:receptor-like protein EIX1 n=1 Tax=Cannabis sativa TaxID=3483 RepID=UPI0029CA17AD|nr:receptor-like protein EIX1 [Cannabis sativa]
MDWFHTFKTAPSLSSLYLYDCQFPDLESFSRTTNSSNSITTIRVYASTFGSTTVSRLLNLSSNLLDLTLLSNFNVKGPILGSFENLKYLRTCYLSLNHFEGKVPKSMGSLCNVRELVMFGNTFNSTLDDIINILNHCKHNSSLEILNLGSNKLQGTFPKNVEHFPMSLKELDISNNELNGNLPKSIAKLSTLKLLDVSNNSFTGVIYETHLENLSKLDHIDLSSNANLTLKLSNKWVPSFQLQYIGLRSCFLGPQFPTWLKTQSNISYLDLSDCGISSVIPSWFFNTSSKLHYLDLSFNFINSTLPKIQLESNNNFPFIDLSSNHFHGHIPPSFLFKVTVLNLSNNTLTQFEPLFCTNYLSLLVDDDYSPKTTILDLSNNLLVGTLPDCLFSLRKLKVINFYSNKLSGVIPSSISSLYQIETLILGKNNLSGTLPSSMKNCTRLVFLDVGENNLRGSIPLWIGEILTNLVVLQLNYNHFHGVMPSNLCHLDSIRILDISHNNINGMIPFCFNNFTSLNHDETFDDDDDDDDDDVGSRLQI